jgi:arylsulfatase A-like enzyme
MSTRRTFLGTGLAAGAGAAFAQTTQKPNFVVIMTDDQGGHDLGCLGAKDLRTPHIDELAAGGARFTNWYSNAPVCAPSRAALMTGRYPARAGVPVNGMALPDSQRSIASLLKPAGYSTALIGKWHLGRPPDRGPNRHGFDEFYGFHSGCVDFYSHRYYWGEPKQVNYHDLYRNREEIFEDGQYLTDRITAEATSFIRRRRDNPFLLMVTYNAPHYPMHAPEPYLQRFSNLEPERRTYAAMIAAVDDGVGQIRAALRQNGVLDNTLMFFIADNGATTEPRAGLNQQPATAGNNSPFRGFKFSAFDGGMHVPGIMNWPSRIAAGQTLSQTVMTMDILPTVCAATGTAIPPSYRVDGFDILPVAARGAKSPHDAIFWEYQQQTAARRGNWKLVLNGREFGRDPESRRPLEGEDSVFLSDLSQDPGETTNLRRKHPNVVDELTGMIHRWREETRPE